MIDFSEICNGASPSRLFREVMSSSPDLEKSDIADILYGQFPGVDGVVIQDIRAWDYDGAPRCPITDDQLDTMLKASLSQAGYLRDQL